MKLYDIYSHHKCHPQDAHNSHYYWLYRAIMSLASGNRYPLPRVMEGRMTNGSPPSCLNDFDWLLGVDTDTFLCKINKAIKQWCHMTYSILIGQQSGGSTLESLRQDNISQHSSQNDTSPTMLSSIYCMSLHTRKMLKKQL